MSVYHDVASISLSQAKGKEGSPIAIPRWVAGAVISKVAPTILQEQEDQMTSAARIYADYLFARNLPLALLSLLLLALGARRMLAGFMVLTALIQAVDVLDDLASGRFTLVPGLTVFAVVFLFGASRLLGRGFWHAEVWRDSVASGAAERQA